MTRTAHYVSSTHWDREWYESFQGFRMRLVALLDEVIETLERDPAFASFVLDGQVIPLHDYLEVRPERADRVGRLLRDGRLRIGPWYVLPDEWLVSGESLVRNLQFGLALTREAGAPPPRAGFVPDQFGHTGQMPQIFAQCGLAGALVWRGTHEREHQGHFWWQAPDGTRLPAFRFGPDGYSTYAFQVRAADQPDAPFNLDEAVDRLVAHVLREAARSPLSPLLLFDGGDHMEIEPQTPALLERANARLAAHDVRIVHSDLDAYLHDLLPERERIAATLTGELRESGRDALEVDQQWLIPGVLSSRIHLKQRNAQCEDELCLWAEPWSAFATAALGEEYPAGYLRLAWRHLLENHPHDSICGCSLDQVHQDMLYRFDQSWGIASRLTDRALRTIARAAVPADRPDGALALVVFNPTAAPIAEPVDLEIPLPADWSARFQEFFGYEEKFAFILRDASGHEIPYQLVGQRERRGFRRPLRKFPVADPRHVVSVTARLDVPAFGYTTLLVVPAPGPTRYLDSLVVAHNAIENELLRVEVAPQGSITLTDKRTGQVFAGLLTFEDRADIGDGWYHGVAVNDEVYTSAASAADVALIADGSHKATLRIATTLHVPAEFDVRLMRRSEHRAHLRIVSEVTLRAGTGRVEVTTTVENTVRDHQLRVLCPTRRAAATYLADAAFDVVERPIALAADNATRRELDVEARPQQTWTAVRDARGGLAVVSRGIPASAVSDTPERPIALTLLRAFRRVVFADDNPGGQVQGTHSFRYDLVPFGEEVPIQELFILGQRLNGSPRAIDVAPPVDEATPRSRPAPSLPPSGSFLSLSGAAIVTAIVRDESNMQVRLFNPGQQTARIRLSQGPAAPTWESGLARAVTLDGRDDVDVRVQATRAGVEVALPPRHITTIVWPG